MHAWEQIQKTVDFIEAHLAEEIRIDDLARSAALSPFYFQRLFHRLVGKPVQEYVKLRRLAGAATALQEPDERILDIALAHGFSSHEVLTRAFKGTYGMTPADFRANPVRLCHFNKPQLLLQYALVDEDVPLITDGIVLEVSRRQLSSPRCFAGLTVEEPIQALPGDGEPKADGLGSVWDAFHRMKPNLRGLTKNGDELGVAFEGTNQGCYRYFAGAESSDGLVEEGCTSWELPVAAYVVCTFEAEDFEQLVSDALFKAQRYLFEMWLPRHGLSCRPFAAELYQSHSPETTSMEVWLALDQSQA